MVQDSPQTSSALTQFVINKVQIEDLGKFTSVIGGRISNDNADGNFLKYSSSAEYVRRVSQSDHGNVLSQRGGVSQCIREAYEHKERKGHPKLPENYKKLNQYFRLFYFHSHNNIAVISLLLHVVDTIKHVPLPSIFSYNFYVFIRSTPCTEPDWNGKSTWRTRS